MYNLCIDMCFHLSQVNAAKVLGTHHVSSCIPFDAQTFGLFPDPMGWTWLVGGPDQEPLKHGVAWTKLDITAALSTDYFVDIGNIEIFFFKANAHSLKSSHSGRCR